MVRAPYLAQELLDPSLQPLPYGFTPKQIFVLTNSTDIFNPRTICANIQLEQDRRAMLPELWARLDSTFGSTVAAFKAWLGKNITSRQAVGMIPDLYEAYLNQELPHISPTFMSELLKLDFAYRKFLVSNDTMRAAYMTQIFSEMFNMMQSTIDLYDQGVSIPS